LTAAAALFEKKQQAAQTYQDMKRTKSGNTGTDTATDGQTPGGLTPTSTGPAGPSPLGATIEAMGDTPGKQKTNPTFDYHIGCLERDASIEDASAWDEINRAQNQVFLLQAAQMAMEQGAQSKADALLQSLVAFFPEQQAMSETGGGAQKNPNLPAAITNPPAAKTPAANKTIEPIMKALHNQRGTRPHVLRPPKVLQQQCQGNERVHTFDNP
jgi:hypothetical protein